MNTGPKRRSCSSNSPSGSEMILRVFDQLGATLPGGSSARRRTRRSRRTSSAIRRSSRISIGAGPGAVIVRDGVRTWTSAIPRNASAPLAV